MASRTRIVTVPLGDRSYPIHIGSGLLARTGRLLRASGITGPMVVITDEHVARHHLTAVMRSAEAARIPASSIIIRAGEQQKSLRTADRIFTELLRRRTERSATIVALGGGVIGDLAGFVAATYQRGVRFVQIPTTLLAQVDSSVGGKVGVNHPLAKNMIGAFHQPALVIADAETLHTLPKREMISGMGEVVKYGMILDKAFFGYTERNLEAALDRDPHVLASMVNRSCELKAYVVSNDEKEQHLRAILNFGHTIGHALEHAGRYGVLRHGEAILYGMVGEAHIAFRNGMFRFAQKERMERLIQRLPLPSLTPLRLRHAPLLEAMMKDKKTSNGVIRMPLPTAIGSVLLPGGVDHASVTDALDYLKVYGS